MNQSQSTLLAIILGASVLALAFALVLARGVLARDRRTVEGTQRGVRRLPAELPDPRSSSSAMSSSGSRSAGNHGGRACPTTCQPCRS